MTDSRGWYYCNTKSNSSDLLTRIQNFSDFPNCDLWWTGSNFLRENRFNDHDVFSNFERDFDKRFNNRDVFSNFEQDFDKSFFHELKSTICLQHNCKHVSDELAGASIETVIYIKKNSSTRKLYRITSCVNRFAKNLKEKLLNNAVLLKPFVTVEELRRAQFQWIKGNQKTFDSIKLKTIWKDLNIICDENGLFRCKGRLKNAPLPYQAKAPYLINSEYYLATLIVNDIHTRFKHISIKQTLTKLRQNFWICRGKQFVNKCLICKKYKGPHYQYPVSPPLSELRMNNDFAFYATGVDNFGPLFVKSIFAKDNSTLFKVRLTLHTCAGTCGVILDVVPHKKF